MTPDEKITILRIYNRHTPNCGLPPSATNENPGQYVGYFANEHGEQWVFIYDSETHSAELYGGDADWETRYPVIDGQPANLVLDECESMWLAACWYAATGLRGEK